MIAGKRISSIRLLLLMLVVLLGSNAWAPHAKSISRPAHNIAGKRQAVFHHDDDQQAAPHIVARIKVRYMGGECGFNGTSLIRIVHSSVFCLGSDAGYSSPAVASHYLSTAALRGPPLPVV